MSFRTVDSKKGTSLLLGVPGVLCGGQVKEGSKVARGQMRGCWWSGDPGRVVEEPTEQAS